MEEDLLEHSPAAHVRPRLDYDSHATGLDRNELGAMLVAAGLEPAQQHALISLLALNGLRVSEATVANIEALGSERAATCVLQRRLVPRLISRTAGKVGERHARTPTRRSGAAFGRRARQSVPHRTGILARRRSGARAFRSRA
ncbi:MAG TPA: hypothetical protein VLW44_22895 [Streptosporangiaceae bacterium]|nr:hypothetical protein [Streptosporangiaceae bacterium]